MPTVATYNQSGVKVCEIQLNDAVFGVEVNEAVMHQAVVRQLSNERLGTHATKTRGMVRGGGRKPWKQKGTGRARAGSSRSPNLDRWWYYIWSTTSQLLQSYAS